MEETMTLTAAAGKLFPLLFNMMGPIGLIPLFVRLTDGMEGPTRVVVARRATGLALVAMVLAVFPGSSMLEAWSISKASLIFAAGLIVTLTALLPLIGSGAGAAPSIDANQPPLQLAVTPLAFPNIVTPRAVAVLIIFVAFFPTLQGKLMVLAVAVAVVFLNLLAMLYARWFMDRIGMTPLLVLGAVFGVLQVALGIEMMADGWMAWPNR